MEKQKTSIIWNLTQQCLWSCKFCCVDAKYVKEPQLLNEQKDVEYSSGDELNYIQKCKVIDQLEPGTCRIDFSGGELFLDPLNLELILKASEKLGAENIGISTSGALITDEIAKRLKNKISDIELSMDCVPYRLYKLRPLGYHEFAAKGVEILKRHGIRMGIQTVLTRENMNKDALYELFKWLEDKQVDDWSLLRFIPVGRGSRAKAIEPSKEEFCEIVDYIKEISKDSKVNICFQYLLPNHAGYTTDCRAVKKSIGILPNGNVVSCFWALGRNMVPIEDKYSLGSVLENSIEEILNNEKSMYWKNCEHKCLVCS